jgi:predicted transglutaminase-like cysteine proteinase
MRQAFKLFVAVTLFAGLVISQTAEAAFFSYPRALQSHILRIQFSSPTLPPFAHSKFCVQYPTDCEVHHIAFRGGKAKMTLRRWLDLVEVNADVNRDIVPERNEEGLAGEKWLISPASGDCNDYAVTKRHELLQRGWPSRALLLAEVVTTWGEHHLVLVVHTQDGDFVADSLSPHIRTWVNAPYQWVRIQSPANPKYWAAVAATTV